MRKAILFFVALLVLLTGTTLSCAWQWHEDNTLLNPTQYPEDLQYWGSWTIGDLGPGVGNSYILKNGESLIRLTPVTELDGIVGWEVDNSYFEGIPVAPDLHQIQLDDWAFNGGLNELLLITSEGDLACYRNNGTPTEPNWSEIGNPFGDSWLPDPPFSVHLCNLDNDEYLDALFLYDIFLRHHEREGFDWVIRDTLHTISDDHWPHHIECGDLDGDNDLDVILMADRPCEYYSYEIIENTGTAESPQFSSEYFKLPTWMNLPIPCDLNGDGRTDLVYQYAVLIKTEEVAFDWEPFLFFKWDRALNFVGDGFGGSPPPWAMFVNYYETPGMHRTFLSGEFTSHGLQVTDWCGDLLGTDTSAVDRYTNIVYFEDLDADNDRDLVLKMPGRSFKQLRNDGTTNDPVWEETDDLFPFELQENSILRKIIDIDGDGTLDVVTENPFQIFQGIPMDDPPYIEWELNETWTADCPEFDMIFGDPDGDGDAELFGPEYGEFIFYQNIGEPGNPEWFLDEMALEGIVYQWGSHAFIDFNNDGKDDLQILSTIYFAGTGTGIEPPMTSPATFSLSVYPNPFNASARIKMNLKADALLKLTVYDLLGRELGVPYFGRASSGPVEIPFNGANLSSGVFILKAEAGSHTQSKRIFLVK